MSSSYLLDANALIALSVNDHEHHGRAAQWASGVERMALCPIVEGALFRFLIRVGESRSTAVALLAALYASRRYEFWADSVSFVTADVGHVVGHRQVTDAYLAALAASRDARLVTFDRALAVALPATVDLIP